MSLIIPPGFAQAALRWSLVDDPEIMISTFGCETSGFAGGALGKANQITDAWAAAFTPPSLGTGYTFIGTRLSVGQDGGPPAIVEDAASIPGTSGTTSLPQNCAVLVKKLSGLGGRRGRGRMFLPGGYLQEGLVANNGMINAAFRGDMQNGMNQFLAAVGMFILHSTGPAGSPAPPAPTAVTQVVVDTRIATQRRRLR
jgi:hypothetical protein